MKTWEYKVLMDVNPYSLNNLGEEGWELVTVIPLNSYKRFYFKREKENKQKVILKNIE